ncbi:hypothetical protein IE81DRAFT_72874 [Ceraceosorus guamensis]|uniref:Dickkopf N-terminal cysteine-rich domain-containing protein n=1 Tax=Ceraceosorus guamensis TaxID=1522189 RepID=A0A316W1M3_9BASI|nr:hypothetical protein IE81DRAFT_72874 [Ceraceosorus guamensis]PWN43632.1 hypothetical protein IE81DRAFT_72874 [Ceraceosorus guamensis]
MRFAPFCALLALATPLSAVSAAPSSLTDADALLNERQVKVLTAGGTLSKGKKCSTSGQCKTNLYCSKSKCATIQGVGGACYKNVGCKSKSCDLKAGKCLGSVGESCKASASCASGYCGNSKCAAKAAVGEACYKNIGCASNICTAGKCAASSTTPPSGGGGGSTLKPVPAHVTRLDDFSNGLGVWTSTGAVKVVMHRRQR